MCNIDDVIDCGTDSLDFFGFFIRDAHIELVLKLHNKLDRIKRISVQIINK